MSCDPNFAAVGLLINCDGTNGQTTFTDLSPAANTVTTNGAAAVTTTLPAFGTGCLGPLGTDASQNTFLSVPITAGGALDVLSGTGDYTIEGFFKANSAVNSNRDLDIFSFGDTNSPTSTSGIVLAASVNAGIIQASATTPLFLGGSVGGSAAMAFDTWYHFALVRRSLTTTLYWNGTALASTQTGWHSSGYSPPAGSLVTFGAAPTVSGPLNPGALDEIRVSKGVARYTANFTPPTQAFPTVTCGATVPNVVGLLDGPAQAAIIAAGLVVGTITIVAGSPPTQVSAQSIPAGTPVSTGTALDLSEYGALVPNVVNTSLLVVTPGILAAAGFMVGTVTYETSGIIIAGNVISQNPAAGSFATPGSGVNLVVSIGLPALRVPDIYGLSQTDAINAITSLGFVVGAIGSAPSQFVPPGEVQAQNPSAGTVAAIGTIVSFVLSTGIPAVGTAFDFEATVISQYANSPVILQLVSNLNQYIDQSANFANFYNFVWNVDTAVGFGLDIWGKIVGVSRLLQIPNTTDYVGFDNGTRSPPDWQSMGSDQPPGPPVGGAMYTGFNATSTYILGDDAYRQLILAKAFANICATTAPAINTILQNLYGPGTAWVLNTGTMAISYNLNFKPSAIQLAILEQSGVIPTPPGVSVTIVTPP